MLLICRGGGALPRLASEIFDPSWKTWTIRREACRNWTTSEALIDSGGEIGDAGALRSLYFRLRWI